MKILEIQVIRKLVDWWKSLDYRMRRIITFASLLIFAAIQCIPVPDVIGGLNRIPIFLYTMLGFIAIIVLALLIGGLWALACHIIKE